MGAAKISAGLRWRTRSASNEGVGGSGKPTLSGRASAVSPLTLVEELEGYRATVVQVVALSTIESLGE